MFVDQSEIISVRDHCSHLTDARLLKLIGDCIEQRAANVVQTRLVYLPKRVVGVDQDHQITCKPCTLDLLRDTQVTGDHDKEMHSSGMEYGNR